METFKQLVEASGPNKTVFSARNRVHSLVHHTTFRREAQARAFADHHKKKGFKTTVKSFRLGPKNHWWQDWSVHIYATDKTPADAKVDTGLLKESNDLLAHAINSLDISDVNTAIKVARNHHASADTLDRIARQWGYPYTHREVVAAHPNASAATLDWIAYHGQREEHRRIIQNPNTSRHTLAKLTSPGLPWVTTQAAHDRLKRFYWGLNESELDDARDELHQNAEIGIRRRLAINDANSPEQLHQLSIDPDPTVRMRVAFNHSASEATINQMAGEAKDEDIIRALMYHPQLRHGPAKQMIERNADLFKKYPDHHVLGLTAARLRVMYLKESEAPSHADLLKQLGQRARGLHMLRRVVDNPNIDPAYLHHLVTTRHTADFHLILATAAGNKAATPATLEAIHQRNQAHIEPFLRGAATGALANNPNTHAELLDKLPHMYGVAHHPNTSGSTLHRIVQNHHTIPQLTQTMTAIARHPHTTPETLELLARNPTPHVRRMVARNPVTPKHILERMAKLDLDDGVAHDAMQTLDPNKI